MQVQVGMPRHLRAGGQLCTVLQQTGSVPTLVDPESSEISPGYLEGLG